MTTKKITLNELRNLVKQIIKENQEIISLNEDQMFDFEEFLRTNIKKGSIAFAFYTAPMDSYMNKYILNDAGVKFPNPMLGKVFKHTRYQFNFDASYEKIALNKNPDYVFGQSKGIYTKNEEFPVIQHGPNGDYFPIVPTKSEARYTVKTEDNDWSFVDYEHLKPYLAQRKSQNTTVPYLALRMDRLAAISAGGNKVKNPKFEYVYLGPGTM